MFRSKGFKIVSRDYCGLNADKKALEKKKAAAKKVEDDEEEEEERVIDINNLDDIMWELDRRSVNGTHRDIEIIHDKVVAYKGEVVDTSLLPVLLCEECEKRNSVLKCEMCDQIFCPKCFNLCHSRPQFGLIQHPHELDKDLFVRPVQEGDTSCVVVDNNFYLPDYECHEEYLKETHDITKPNTLVTTEHYKVIDKVPLNQAISKLMYKEGDVLVYIDPVTKVEVYGRVESDWDFRNDRSAPTLIRGEGGGLTWYVVRYLGEVTPKVLELLEQDKALDYDETADEETKRQEALMLDIPNLDGVGSSMLRQERLMASRINKRIAKMKKIVKFGPKHHLNPAVPKGFGTVNDGDDSSVGAIDDHSSLCSSSLGPPPGVDSLDDDAMYRKPKTSRGGSSMISTKKLTETEIRQANLPKDIAARRTLDGLVAAYSYINEVQAELNHEVYHMSDEEPLIKRRLKILLLAENSLTRPSDRLKLMQLRQKEKIRRALVKRFARMFGGWTSWAFSRWKDLSDRLRAEEHFRCAQFIQKHIRRFLMRNLLEELRFKSSALMHERWKKLHAKFNYCRWDTPGAVTMDNKIYFRGIRDVNAYGRALRISLVKFIQVAEKRRMEMLTHAVAHWKEVINDMQMSDLKASHFLPFDPTHDQSHSEGRRVDLTAKTQEMHQQLHDEFISKSLKEVPKDIDWSKVNADPADDTRLDLNSMLMGTERKVKNVNNITEVTPPPWHPSVGFTTDSLPAMPPLPDLVLNNKKAPVNKPYPHTLEDIQKYNSFRVKFQGPTDHSFWVIPGRLAMGRLPLGRARRHGPVDSSLHTMIDCIPQLLLAGISSFVSTMTPDEEAGEIRDYNKYATSIGAPLVDDITTQLHKDQKKVRATLKDSIINLKFRIEDKNIQLRDYLHIEDAPLRTMRGEMMSSVRMRQKSEKVRLKAKQWLLKEDVETTQTELDKVAEKVAWDNYPLTHNEAPLYEKIIPILWDIEQRMFNGETIYLYSKEGKGRSGMICALVMGRIYGLSATDTLLRMQTYFDCQKSQHERKVSANCPQLRRQQDLVSRILQSTNNIYTGIQYRSQVDPETFIAENQHLKAGTPTLQNTKEYAPSVGGYVQTKTSYLMKQKAPTQKFKANAKAILENSDASQRTLITRVSADHVPALLSTPAPDAAKQRRHTVDGEGSTAAQKSALVKATSPPRAGAGAGAGAGADEMALDLRPVKQQKEAKESERVLLQEIKQMYDSTSIERAGLALVRPIEQRRPVYCDRPSQVHIDKTFSKLKKVKPSL
mmetsp:Transcript_20241/g.34121  ORF Transcript_20241/g.34121 Transcript_20241/m.34121 type:complete len:1274 (+) Transcript_20241:165-3986(+)